MPREAGHSSGRTDAARERALDPDLTLPGVPAEYTDDTLIAAGPTNGTNPENAENSENPTTVTTSRRLGGGGRYARGQTLGRYVVLSKLGEGGMGVVYAAYDPELDRKIAVKLVRAGVGGDAQLNHARLQREAQALAKLSHPNIVGIYDVGTVASEVWLAMEFVSGQTFGAWLATRERSWLEVLGVMRPAGEGLAAAHAAGLVHRDFKLENVMIDDDGRVRVLDFGLARQSQHSPESAPTPELDTIELGARESSLASELTRPGAVSGTPRYMSPEQFSGRDAGGSSDQFSFCVALWEALYGEPPFAGSSLVELCVSITEGRRRPPPRGRDVPGWLREVVERGLATQPEARWPSMLALLDALEHSRSRRQRRRVLLSLGVVAALVGGAVGLRGVQVQQLRSSCAALGAEVDEVWNEGTQASLDAALGASGKSYARATAERVLPALASHASQWREARTEACLDAQERETSSGEAYDRQLHCLDISLARLRHLVSDLGQPSDQTLMRAVTALGSLGQVSDCGNAATLELLPLPPKAQREAVQTAREHIAHSQSQVALGRFDAARSSAQAALAEAVALSWGPVVAESKLQLGRVERSHANYEPAHVLLREAYFEAAAAGADASALAAALELSSLVAIELARIEEGEEWHRHAEVLRARVPDPDALYHARSLAALATIRAEQAEYAEAIAHYEHARTLLGEALGPHHPQLAELTSKLSSVHNSAGARELALALALESLAILEEQFGPEHPKLVGTLNNIATLYGRVGRHDEAEALFRRSIGVLEAALGPEHLKVGKLLVNLGNIHSSRGEHDEMIACYERALPILEAELGPEHPVLASVLNNLGWARLEQERLGDARKLFEQALAIREASYGPDHQALCTSLDGLGKLARLEGNFEQAWQHYSRSAAIIESHSGPEHPELAYSLNGLASTAIDQGDHARALPLSRRANALFEGAEADPIELAGFQYPLAFAIAGTGGAWSEAEALALQALKSYRSAEGPHYADTIAKIEAFLAAGPS